MKKSEIWTKVLEIAENHNLSNEVIKELSTILEPKRGGGHSNRIIKEIDGKIYKNCRFTNRLWSEDDLVYQNDEMKSQGKDKGYSKVGISLWNKGQKYIKDLKQKLLDMMLSEDVDTKKLKKLKDELKKIEEKNLGNDSEWLIRFATEEQIAEIGDKSLPIED